MKILDVQLKNLNSLRGEWHIDLTDNAYLASGIFAITGPTGAGKTTIFDAICLALYGQTPRLGKITGSRNEVMSKHTADCYARVVFEAEGKQYLCLWNQHISSGGKLQGTKHTIAELPSGTEIPLTVKDITGMDFKRFTQAVMLEQGGFDAFLKADKKERSQILEMLTGTEIYGQISTAVYDRTDEERAKLDDIQRDIDSKKPRDNFGSEEEIKQLLAANTEELSQLNSAQERMKESVDWLKYIRRLEQSLDQADESLTQLRKRMDNFAANRTMLEAALRAQELSAEHAALKAKRSQFNDTRTRFDDSGRKITACTAELSHIDEQELPALNADFDRHTRNITGEPNAVYAQAVELMNIYTQLAKKRPKIARDKDIAEKALLQSQARVKSAEEEYRVCLKRYNEAAINQAKKQLKPGEPCPVCGSREHPGIAHYGETAGTGFSTTDFERASKKLTDAQTAAASSLTRLEQLTLDLSNSLDETTEARTKVLSVIEPMGIFDAGVKDCGEINSRLERWIDEVKALTAKIQSSTQRRENLSTSIATLKESFDRDKANLEILSGELESMEADFRAHLADKGFSSEEDFMKSQISPADLTRLQNSARELDENMSKILAVQAERSEKLNAEKAKSLTTESLENLEPKFRESNSRLEVLRKTVYELEHALNERRKMQTEILELESQRKIQQKIYNNWAELNELIGQKNGGKFRVFAQQITLKLMIELANKQLVRMSGRYTLTATPDSDGLRLSVIDKEQAGEIRPTENLSGGERFIVSLALALGLSQISGSKARVDSLFLDEGFGSLDEDSLSTALEALGEIRREGRMIGIISHVQALRERISAQISVIPKNEGTSILDGPGCSKL